jgi:hypothetical protein
VKTDKQRISELEAEVWKLREAGTVLAGWVDERDATIARLRGEVSKARTVTAETVRAKAEAGPLGDAIEKALGRPERPASSLGEAATRELAKQRANRRAASDLITKR